MRRFWLSWLLLLAALSARAAELYAPPSPEWTAAVAPHVSAVMPELSVTDPRAMAPIVSAMSTQLHLTPESFAALAPEDQATVVSLAAEHAQAEVSQKAYELVGQAKPLVWGESSTLSSEQAGQLYDSATALREVNKHYSAYLHEDAREDVAATAAQAASRWIDLRARMTAQALTGREEAANEPRFDPAKAPRKTYSKPSVKAVKLVEAMRGTKSGWSADDMETVYLGYGFIKRNGGKHIMYTHPDFPQLHTAVSRQRSLPPGYAQTAVKLVEELEELQRPPSAIAAAPEEAELLPLPEAPVKPAPVVEKIEQLAPIVATLEPEAAKPETPKMTSKPAAPAKAPALERAAPAPEFVPVPEQLARPEPGTPKLGWYERLRAWLRSTP